MAYSIGIDYGTLSGRAVIVDLTDGKELAMAVYEYTNGVIDKKLPGSNIRLEPDWALQDPADYVQVLKVTIPAVLKESGVAPLDVIGIGIDFTACTMLPTLADGTPLCFLEEYRQNPHAWVKLWKHHAAQPEANELNQIAREKGYGKLLDRYGGKISSEWFFPKVWQILNEAPEIYAAADRMIEAADWIIWQMTGEETRNSCTAGYKAMWSKTEGFPPVDFFMALDPRLANVVDEKMKREILPLGSRAGGLTAQAAEWTGLLPGTSVAVGNVDAHVAVPAATVVDSRKMVMTMGTSICHLVISDQEELVPGMCGVVIDGIIPGKAGYEAGQSCVGDMFQWFREHCVPESYFQEATERKLSVYKLLEEKARGLKPGANGLLALDWWNGNRSILVDAELTGLILGMTLQTRPEEIFRALIEATAYGTHLIVDTFKNNHVPIDVLVATGGLPDRNELLMQIYADVTGLEILIPDAAQISAVGSAMHGAVAAGALQGGYDDIIEASHKMTHLQKRNYVPDAEAHALYTELYREYVILHDYFGRGENNVMKLLKRLKIE